jgi:hypothetical protein
MLANIPRLQALMKRDSLAAVISTCPENVTYPSGFWARRNGCAAAHRPMLFPRENCPVFANSCLLDLFFDQ